MDQQGLTPRDLEPYLGSSGRVSEVLNRKRKLSLGMIKRLHDGLRIPYESLLAGVACPHAMRACSVPVGMVGRITATQANPMIISPYQQWQIVG